MIFVEGVRLIVVLLGALLGYELGKRTDGTNSDAVIGLMIGAGVSYVIGGIIGRILD